MGLQLGHTDLERSVSIKVNGVDLAEELSGQVATRSPGRSCFPAPKADCGHQARWAFITRNLRRARTRFCSCVGAHSAARRARKSVKLEPQQLVPTPLILLRISQMLSRMPMHAHD